MIDVIEKEPFQPEKEPVFGNWISGGEVGHLNTSHFSGRIVSMASDNHESTGLNAERSLALASALFPSEEWIPTEANIWVAKSRLAQEKREPDKWEREMAQVRIIINT